MAIFNSIVRQGEIETVGVMIGARVVPLQAGGCVICCSDIFSNLIVTVT